MDAAITELKTAFDAYATKVDAYITSQKVDVQAAIDAAIAKDDAEEAVDLNQVKADVMAAMDRIPPAFDPSGNG